MGRDAASCLSRPTARPRPYHTADGDRRAHVAGRRADLFHPLGRLALIRQRGHATDYIPWTVKIGVTDRAGISRTDRNCWRRSSSSTSSAVVFDGTYPFPGLINVASVPPGLGLGLGADVPVGSRPGARRAPAQPLRHDHRARRAGA